MSISRPYCTGVPSTVTPYICESAVFILLLVILLAPKILRLLVGFGENCWPLMEAACGMRLDFGTLVRRKTKGRIWIGAACIVG